VAGAAEAHRSSALHGHGALFFVFSLPTEPVGARNSPRGSSTDGGLQSWMCGGKVEALTFGDGGGTIHGSAHDKVGPNGCGVEHRTPASGQWSSKSVACGVAMKGANLGFVSIFFEIPTQLPSIYGGFGLIISCVCV
jgi:hypothetical protein